MEALGHRSAGETQLKKLAPVDGACARYWIIRLCVHLTSLRWDGTPHLWFFVLDTRWRTI